MKKNIAVVYGGNSGEYEISVSSGQIVTKYLNREKYNVFPVLIRGTRWKYIDTDGKEYPVNKNDFSVELSGDKIFFDGVFIAIHGSPGEDGRLQGYLDMLDIPYSSCNHTVSAVTFNKSLCKNVVSGFEVLTARSLFFTKGQNVSPDDILQKLSLPLFIKPNNGGSSVGMSKVSDKSGLLPAIKRAFEEDDEILIEEFVEGREITCGVLKNKGKLIVFPVTEIISKKEFFDYEAKYSDGLVEEVVPADIPDTITTQCRKTSSDLYEKLNCRGVVRFDYIFNDNGLYFLEVNTIPGMTEASIIPKMAKAYGMSLEELFDIITEETLFPDN